MRMLRRLQVATTVAAITTAALLSPPALAAVDTAPPAVDVDAGLFFKVGTVLSPSDGVSTPSILVNVTWRASDNVGITSQYGFLFQSQGWEYEIEPAPAVRQDTIGLRLDPGGASSSAQLWAYDAAGNEGSDYEDFRTELFQQNRLTASAGWSTANCSCWSGGSVATSSKKGASMKYRFTGNSIAVIGDYASNRGTMKVYLDGVLQSTVITAGVTKNRVVIYQKRFNTSQTHTIKLVVGTGRVDVDALIVQN